MATKHLSPHFSSPCHSYIGLWLWLDARHIRSSVRAGSPGPWSHLRPTASSCCQGNHPPPPPSSLDHLFLALENSSLSPYFHHNYARRLVDLFLLPLTLRNLFLSWGNPFFSCFPAKCPISLHITLSGLLLWKQKPRREVSLGNFFPLVMFLSLKGMRKYKYRVKKIFEFLLFATWIILACSRPVSYKPKGDAEM